MLAIGARPDLLDRADQPGRAISHDEAWRGEPAGDELAAELEPVLLALPHPQPHGNQRPVAVLSDSPGTDHALLPAAGTDRQIDRVEEQNDELDLEQVAALKRLKPLVQLRANPSRPSSARSSPGRPPHTETRCRASIGRARTHRRSAPLAGRSSKAACSATSGTALRRTASPTREPAESRSQAHPRPSARAGAGTRCASHAAALAGAHNEPGPTTCRTLLLDRPLNDQPGPEPGELRQHLLPVIGQSPWTSACRCSLVSPPTAVRCVSRRRPASSSART